MRKENSTRRFPGESNRNRPDKAAERREAAQKRQEECNKLTPQQRLERLDMKFGVGQGAGKERAKLKRAMEAKLKTVSDIETLDRRQLPEEVMQEIAAMNNEDSGKKRIKAKERRKNDKKD